MRLAEGERAKGDIPCAIRGAGPDQGVHAPPLPSSFRPGFPPLLLYSSLFSLLWSASWSATGALPGSRLDAARVACLTLYWRQLVERVSPLTQPNPDQIHSETSTLRHHPYPRSRTSPVLRLFRSQLGSPKQSWVGLVVSGQAGGKRSRRASSGTFAGCSPRFRVLPPSLRYTDPARTHTPECSSICTEKGGNVGKNQARQGRHESNTGQTSDQVKRLDRRGVQTGKLRLLEIMRVNWG